MGQFCRLCLEESVSFDNLIEIFDDKENPMKISDILNLHFSWLETKPLDEQSKTICVRCWNIINEFHSLYVKVDAAHKELKEQFVKVEVTFDEPLYPLDSSLFGNESEVSCDDSKSMGELDSWRSVAPKEINQNNQSSSRKKLIKKKKRKVKEKTTATPNRILKSKSERLEEEKNISEFFNLSCDECSITFPTFFNLRVHQQSVHNHKAGFVYCCNKKLKGQAQLLEHLNWHLNPDLFRCKICHKVYSDNYCLRLHMAFHTSEVKNFECDICSKKFSRKSQLTHHIMVVHVTKYKKDLTCEECGKTFGLNSALQSHIRGVHQNFYRHVCDICAKEFKSKDQYQRHRVQHLEATPKIVCDCGARLKNKMSLQAHIRQQHQKNPQTCPECGKMSPSLSALRSHIRYNHRISRQHQCTVCDKSFKREITLKEHVATHLGITLYTCPYCPKTFNSTGSMYSHRKKIHFPEWQRDRTRLASN